VTDFWVQQLGGKKIIKYTFTSKSKIFYAYYIKMSLAVNGTGCQPKAFYAQVRRGK
jgi:hypothetical protein